MPRHRDLAEGLRAYLEVAGVKRPELYTTDKTRKAITFHHLHATGLTWMAIRGDEPLRIMQRAGHERASRRRSSTCARPKPSAKALAKSSLR
jgi:hypothetical protein